MSVVSDMNTNALSAPNDSREEELTSVDETFSKYSIAQVQQLTKSYKNKADTAKQELYDLVGSKYRDLIKIAEDIGDMYTNSQEVNQKLSDLSYSSSKFVSYDSNSYASYYTHKRIQDAQVVREKEKFTILNILISDELLQFQMKLKSSSAPFVHTSVILHYAKIFYTIENLFKELLADKSTFLSKKYYSLKDSFIEYLETQISTYNPSSSSLYSAQNDVLRNSDVLQIEEITSSHGIITDKVDAYLDDGDIYIEDLQHTDEGFENEYNRTLNPLVHFLSAYIVLNQEMNSLSRVFERFIDLRCSYLKKVCDFALESNNSTFVDFSKALKYIENTLEYSFSYFKSTENDLIQNIKSYANNWSGNTIISYHSWFSDDEIDLGLNKKFNEMTPESKLYTRANEMIKILSGFINECIKVDSTDILSSTSDLFLVFHNFVYCLQTLNNKKVENGTTSYFIDILSHGGNEDILQTFFADIKKSIEQLYDIKIGELNNPNSGISSKLISNIEKLDFKESKNANPIFTEESLSLMDSDLNEYIKSISNFSLRSSEEELGIALNSWFDVLTQFMELLSLNDDMDFNQITAINCIEHLSKVLEAAEKSDSRLTCSKFTRTDLISGFKVMSSSLLEKLWTEIGSFIQEIQRVIDEQQERVALEDHFESVYYILRILLILKEKLNFYDNGSTQSTELLTRTDVLISQTYKNIFEIIKNTSFMHNFDRFLANMDKESQRLSNEMPLRPSLYLSSLMYNLSKELISLGDKSTHYEFGTLYLNEVSTSIYIPVKNEWIRKFLIQDKIMGILIGGKFIPSVSKEIKEIYLYEDIDVDISETDLDSEANKKEDETKESEKEEEISKELSQKFLYAFANIAFLLQFSTPDKILDTKNENIKIVLDKLHEFGAKKCLNETTIQFILKGIYDFFKSNKGLYIPLSI